MPEKISSFGLKPGRKLGRGYIVRSLIGRGIEGEVYEVLETDTGILRAAKIYFPHCDPSRQRSIRHARKLDALRRCPIVLQYHHSETLTIKGTKTIAMVSELCAGEPLGRWIERHRGKRLRPYIALHVLYNLVLGLQPIHRAGEYHGDVHTDNILIDPKGIGFTLRLVDFYDWGKPAKFKQRQDILDTIGVFYDCLGGKPHYAKQPPEAKYICGGMKHSLILKRFPNIGKLRQHLEEFKWETVV